MQTVKVLPKGQITIPKDVRKHMGIKVGDTLVIEEADDKVVLKKVRLFLIMQALFLILGCLLMR